VPNSPGPFGPGPAPGPIAPTHRPRWLLVLSAVTLMQGGMLLVSGLGDLRNPTSVPANLVMPQPLAPDQEALARELLDVNKTILERHAHAIRVRAAASMALALLLLYSAAAALSRDRHGRAATLTAAWLGIAYQLGSLPVTIPIAADYAVSSAPIFARAVASDLPELIADAGAAAAGGAPGGAVTGAGVDGGAAAVPAPAAPSAEPPLRPEAVAAFMHKVFIGAPIVTAILGIFSSLLLITYFGGRRGRALYGLPPRRSPPRR